MAKKPAKRRKPAPKAKKAAPAIAAPVVTQSDTQKRAFLAAFAETGNIRRAALTANVSRQSHYRWMDDPDYAKRFQAAQEEASDILEEEARRRAIAGLRRYKFHQGTPAVGPDGEPYYELEYSDTLLIFLLKGARPDKYAERLKHDVAAAPEQFDPAKLEILRSAGMLLIESEVVEAKN